ncbi:hypothetical protein FO519_010276 [Halicephalobus sp. NKZ332]|nr:hypothetical protein FO519_010276 [Halicephalobus sp. NKZ332]
MEEAPREELEKAYKNYMKIFEDNSEEFEKWERKREKNRNCYRENLKNNLDEFLKFIGKDGIFAIKMIHNNTGYHIAGFIISKIFEKYICLIKTEGKFRSELTDSEIEYMISSPPKTSQTIVYFNDDKQEESTNI